MGGCGVAVGFAMWDGVSARVTVGCCVGDGVMMRAFVV